MEAFKQLLHDFGIDLTDPQWEYMTEDLIAVLKPNEILQKFHIPVNQKTFNQVKQILFQIRKNLNLNFSHFVEDKTSTWILSSSSNNINSLFKKHGLESRNLYLIYGKARTGKTQFAHALCVEVIKHFRQQSLEPHIIYIDSEQTFRPERIIDMLNHHEIHPQEYLNFIKVIQISDPKTFLRKLKDLNSLLTASSINLLIIDSLTKIFRLALAQNPQNFKDTISILIQSLKELREIAERCNIPILCTSQVASTFVDEYFFDVIPILSATLNHFIKNWILFAVQDQIVDHSPLESKRFAHLINSDQIAEKIVQFRITKTGIKDLE